MTTLIKSCECGAKVVFEKKRNVVSTEKCDCPWPEIVAPAPPEIRSADWVEELRRYWTDRRERLTREATEAAGKTEYGAALRKISMADAVELCLADLNDVSSSTK